MGLFDTIKMTCPGCGDDWEEQIKPVHLDGEMLRFNVTNCPAVVLDRGTFLFGDCMCGVNSGLYEEDGKFYFVRFLGENQTLVVDGWTPMTLSVWGRALVVPITPVEERYTVGKLEFDCINKARKYAVKQGINSIELNGQNLIR